MVQPLPAAGHLLDDPVFLRDGGLDAEIHGFRQPAAVAVAVVSEFGAHQIGVDQQMAQRILGVADSLVVAAVRRLVGEEVFHPAPRRVGPDCGFGQVAMECDGGGHQPGTGHAAVIVHRLIGPGPPLVEDAPREIPGPEADHFTHPGFQFRRQLVVHPVVGERQSEQQMAGHQVAVGPVGAVAVPDAVVHDPVDVFRSGFHITFVAGRAVKDRQHRQTVAVLALDLSGFLLFRNASGDFGFIPGHVTGEQRGHRRVLFDGGTQFRLILCGSQQPGTGCGAERRGGAAQLFRVFRQRLRAAGNRLEHVVEIEQHIVAGDIAHLQRQLAADADGSGRSAEPGLALAGELAVEMELHLVGGVADRQQRPMAVGRFAPSVQPSVRRFRAGNAGQPDRPPGFPAGSQHHFAERKLQQRASAARRGAHPHRQRAGGRQQRRVHHECFTGGKTQHAAGLCLRNRPAAAVCGFDPQLRRGDFGGEIKFRFRHERLGSRVADLRQCGGGSECRSGREHHHQFFHDISSFQNQRRSQ